MNKTNNFYYGEHEHTHAVATETGHIEVFTFGTPYLTTEQARQFAFELTRLANELEK